MHSHTRTHTHIHTHGYTHMDTHTDTHIHTHTHTHTNKQTNKHKHTTYHWWQKIFSFMVGSYYRMMVVMMMMRWGAWWWVTGALLWWVLTTDPHWHYLSCHHLRDKTIINVQLLYSVLNITNPILSDQNHSSHIQYSISQMPYSILDTTFPCSILNITIPIIHIISPTQFIWISNNWYTIRVVWLLSTHNTSHAFICLHK